MDAQTRPLLRPGTLLAWRSEADLVVGWGTRSLLIRAAPPLLGRWLRCLDGLRTFEQLRPLAARWHIDAEDAARVVEALSEAGLLSVHGPGRTLVVLGTGWGVEQLRGALRSLGLHVEDEASESGVAVVHVLGEVPSLWDSPSAATLVPVWFGADAVHLGPAIRAGEGLCRLCVDGWRGLWNSDWPLLVAQARTLRPEVPALSVWAAACFLASAERGGFRVLDGAEAVLDMSDPVTRWRVWEPLPGCACDASGQPGV